MEYLVVLVLVGAGAYLLRRSSAAVPPSPRTADHPDPYFQAARESALMAMQQWPDAPPTADAVEISEPVEFGPVSTWLTVWYVPPAIPGSSFLHREQNPFAPVLETAAGKITYRYVVRQVATGRDGRYNPGQITLTPADAASVATQLERAVSALDEEQRIAVAPGFVRKVSSTAPHISVREHQQQLAIRYDLASSTGYRFGGWLTREEAGAAAARLRGLHERVATMIKVRVEHAAHPTGQFSPPSSVANSSSPS